MFTNTFINPTKIMDVFERFSETGEKIAEYKYAKADYANPTSAANSLRAHLKRNYMAKQYKVMVKGDKVYMCNMMI